MRENDKKNKRIRCITHEYSSVWHNITYNHHGFNSFIKSVVIV